MNRDMRREAEIAGIAEAITVLEARLIAARHLRLVDRIRLLESEKQKLESRLTNLNTKSRGGWGEPC